MALKDDESIQIGEVRNYNLEKFGLIREIVDL